MKKLPHRLRAPGKGHTRQRGVTMVMALVFLLVLTALGAWAAVNNTLQERMAGNTRNRDLAFQAAEAALKEAENTLTTWRTQPFDGSNGLLAYTATEANDQGHWRNDAQWTSYRSATVTLNQVATAPRYVVQRLPNTENPTSPGVFNVENYRITARATGGDSSAMVIVQSIVSYTP